MRLLVFGGGGFLGYHVVAEALQMGHEVSRALAEGGEVLAPGDPQRPVQFSDARDVAAWMVGMLAAGTPGIYNAVGPGRDDPVAEVLDACRLAAGEVDGGGPERVGVTWVAEEFLREQLREVQEEQRPLWFPEDQIPFQRVDSSKALAAGLTFRPAYETARDTLSWIRSTPGGPELAAGFSADTERELLRRWSAARLERSLLLPFQALLLCPSNWWAMYAVSISTRAMLTPLNMV